MIAKLAILVLLKSFTCGLFWSLTCEKKTVFFENSSHFMYTKAFEVVFSVFSKGLRIKIFFNTSMLCVKLSYFKKSVISGWKTSKSNISRFSRVMALKICTLLEFTCRKRKWLKLLYFWKNLQNKWILKTVIRRWFYSPS